MLGPGVYVKELGDPRPMGYRALMKYENARITPHTLRQLRDDIAYLKRRDIDQGLESMCSRNLKDIFSQVIETNWPEERMICEK